jgi:16S rRNA (cytosine1402-N4)-methyltransferase
MYTHVSVLLQEAINYLNIDPNGIYVDCTLGGGGHSYQILKYLDKGHLYAFDQDEYAISKANDALKEFKGKYTIIHSNFRNLVSKLHELGVEKVDGILYDLGVSSFQFDIPERGFSYRHDAFLDMRMDTTSPLRAYDIVNEYSFQDLVYILNKYGEEKNAKRIARQIEKRRSQRPIETTMQLVDIIKKSLPQKQLSKKGHPAKQTFQALRIAVNDELQAFEESLEQAFQIVRHKGRIVVITFHSLEDRMTKRMFQEKSTLNYPKNIPIPPDLKPEFRLLHKKVIRPSDDELSQNKRAHSAKLRAIEKL